MHRKGQLANRLALSCAFFSLMRYLEYDSTVNSNYLQGKWVFFTHYYPRRAL